MKQNDLGFWFQLVETGKWLYDVLVPRVTYIGAGGLNLTLYKWDYYCMQCPIPFTTSIPLSAATRNMCLPYGEVTSGDVITVTMGLVFDKIFVYLLLFLWSAVR